MTFLDTSALVKRYVSEAGSEVAGRLDGPLVVSLLARVEAPAAVWRKHRLGDLGSDDARRVCDRLAGDLAGGESDEVIVLGLPRALVAHASELVERHPLTGADAIQLASAIAARDVGLASDRFASADRRLCAAALDEGFTLVDGL